MQKYLSPSYFKQINLKKNLINTQFFNPLEIEICETIILTLSQEGIRIFRLFIVGSRYYSWIWEIKDHVRNTQCSFCFIMFYICLVYV